MRQKSNLPGAILLIYKTAPGLAIISDFLFVVGIIVEMLGIAVAGSFLDETVTILGTWDSFSLESFFYSRAFWYFALDLFLWIILLLTQNMRSFLRDKIYRAYYRQIQNNVLQKISTQNLQEFEDQKFQDLLAYVQGYSVTNIFAAYENFTEFVRQIIRFFSVIGFVFSVMGLYSLLVFVFVLPECISELYRQKQIAKYIEKNVYRVKLINYLLSLLTDYNNFSELKISRTFRNLKKMFAKKLSIQDRGLDKYDWHYWTDKTFFGVLDQTIFRFYSILIIAIAIVRKMSIGDFQALFNYIKTAYSAAFNIFNRFFWMQKNSIYIDKYYEFINYDGFGDLSSGETIIEKGVPRLQFHSLDFKYHYKDTKSLENLSFVVEPGSKTLFVGGDSSGKTTLMRVLCGFYEITAGDYTVNGHSIRELARGELKKRLSIIDQDFNRYHFTIKENIVLNPNKINNERYEEVKKISQVDSLMTKLKVDDKQMLGKFFNGGMDLSPAHWQRIAIARMLYKKADVYIMDEPFVFIDPKNRRDILLAMRKFLVDKTVIILSKEKFDDDLFDDIIKLDK